MKSVNQIIPQKNLRACLSGVGGGVDYAEVWPNICEYRQITEGCGAQKNEVFIDKCLRPVAFCIL